MAQPGTIKVDIDITAARRKVRGLLSLAREANAELAKLDEVLAGLETKRAELAELGINLVLEEN